VSPGVFSPQAARQSTSAKSSTSAERDFFMDRFQLSSKDTDIISRARGNVKPPRGSFEAVPFFLTEKALREGFFAVRTPSFCQKVLSYFAPCGIIRDNQQAKRNTKSDRGLST
jgi:hypothetical protein